MLKKKVKRIVIVMEENEMIKENICIVFGGKSVEYDVLILIV